MFTLAYNTPFHEANCRYCYDLLILHGSMTRRDETEQKSWQRSCLDRSSKLGLDSLP